MKFVKFIFKFLAVTEPRDANFIMALFKIRISNHLGYVIDDRLIMMRPFLAR